MNPTLLITQGVQHGQLVQLTATKTVFGRSTQCDFQLFDLEVSRQHFAIELRPDHQVWLVDLKSHNGTYVNGIRVREFQLQAGDTIRIGQTELLYNERPSRMSDTSEITAVIGEQSQNPTDLVFDELLAESRNAQRLSDSSATVSPSSPQLSRAKSTTNLHYQLAQLLRLTLDSDELLREMLRLVFDWIEADRGCIVLLDSEVGGFQIVTSLSRIPNDDQPMVISQSIVNYVYSELEGVLIQNASSDPRCLESESVVALGIREAICVPLLVRQGFRGAIYLDTLERARDTTETPTNVFNEDHLQLLISFGQQAAIALDNAHYYNTLLESQRLTLLGQTVASLAHDVRGILQSFYGGMYQFEDSWKRQDHFNMAAGWEILKNTHQRMSNLVMDMLSFSGPRQPVFQDQDVGQLVRDVLQMAASLAKNQGVALRYLGEHLLPPIQLDQEGIFRALLNIVLNAIDACQDRQDSLITVSTKLVEDDETLAIVVHDNGQGISAKEMPYLFEPFRTTKGLRGTGLGLAVSQKILKEHGGEIKVNSTLGQGSEFTMLIPAKRSLPDSNTIVSPEY